MRSTGDNDADRQRRDEAVLRAHRWRHLDACPGYGVGRHFGVELVVTDAGVLCTACAARMEDARRSDWSTGGTGQPGRPVVGIDE
jgi:hypothetical protein